MRQTLLAMVVAALCGVATMAQDKEKDTPSAANTRTKKLQVKVTVNFKDDFLKSALDEINDKIEEAGGQKFSFKNDTGVSLNQRVTFKGDKVTVAEALDGMFKKNGLGYIIISKPKDRYDGWLLIKQGDERGSPKTEEKKKDK